MKTSRLLVFFVIALLSLGLFACERPLTSVEERATATVAGPGELPGEDTNDVMEEIWQLATQTALARQTEQGETPGDATPVPPTDTEAQPPAEETESSGTVDTAAPPAATATTAPPAETVEFEPPPVPDTYTLRSGEFPFCIARRFDIDPGSLLSANNLGLNSRPPAGFTLRIPSPGGNFPGSRALRSHPTTYSVQSGDNINEIACLFGDVYPEAIAAANNLTPPYNLSPGQTLQIP